MAAVREGEGDIRPFKGEFPNLVPTHSTDLISSRMFFYAGQLISYCCAHGGISVVGISPVIAAVLRNDDMEAVCDKLCIKDIPDPTLREIVDKVNESLTFT